MKPEKLTREDILLPVLAAWAHEEISIGRARELLHMPDDKIRREAEHRVSNAVKEREYRDLLEHHIQDLGMMIRRLLRRLPQSDNDMSIIHQAQGLLERCGVDNPGILRDGMGGPADELDRRENDDQMPAL